MSEIVKEAISVDEFLERLKLSNGSYAIHPLTNRLNKDDLPEALARVVLESSYELSPFQIINFYLPELLEAIKEYSLVGRLEEVDEIINTIINAKDKAIIEYLKRR